jgi:hypothetical protein
MNRRARLPGADELFRATGGQPAPAAPPASGSRTQAHTTVRRTPAQADDDLDGFDGQGDRDSRDGQGRNGAAGPGFAVVDNGVSTRTPSDGGWAEEYPPARASRGRRTIPDARPTGRERHDEKITVYCSPEELLQIEHARLNLRGSHGLAVDRGRIVREAIAVVLADLEAKGDASILVRRLRGR